MDKIVITQLAAGSEDVFALDSTGRAWIWDEDHNRWEPLPEVPQLREVKAEAGS